MPEVTASKPEFDRTALKVTSFAEAEREDRAFWHAKSPLERLQHLEALREMNHGSEVLNQRFQRVLEILERSRS